MVGELGKVEARIPTDEVRVGRRGEHWIGGVEVETGVQDERVAYAGGHHGSSYVELLHFLEAVVNGTPV